MYTDFKSMDPDALSVGERQQLLTALIAPRPIAFASTVNKEGLINLSPFSFFNVFSANPPVLVFSPSRRGRDGTTKHTYENLKEVPEVCISVVNYAMVEQMSLASTEYDYGVNEFEKAGFTAIPSDTIQPPRVAESPANFECTVNKIIELGEEGGSGNLVVATIQKIHIQKQYIGDTNIPDTTQLDLVARMGGNWYSRAHGESLFEIPKPLRNKGIGVDQLPPSIRNSSILTGNNLGRLGNSEEFPSSELIEKVRQRPDLESIYTQFSGNKLEAEVHKFAQVLLEQNEVELAFAVLVTLYDE